LSDDAEAPSVVVGAAVVTTETTAEKLVTPRLPVSVRPEIAPIVDERLDNILPSPLAVVKEDDTSDPVTPEGNVMEYAICTEPADNSTLTMDEVTPCPALLAMLDPTAVSKSALI
jgi:hypothetical protein